MRPREVSPLWVRPLGLNPEAATLGRPTDRDPGHRPCTELAADTTRTGRAGGKCAVLALSRGEAEQDRALELVESHYGFGHPLRVILPARIGVYQKDA